MLINIRGNLGAQVTSSLAGLAHYVENNASKISFVHNTHNYPKWLYDIAPDSINITFIEKVLNFSIPVSVDKRKGVGKTDAFNMQNAHLIIKNLDQIRTLVSIKDLSSQVYSDKGCIHCRAFDRNLLDKNNVKKLLNRFPDYILCGDDKNFISQFNHPFFHENVILDWDRIYKSKNVCAAFSAFVFSLALLDPSFKLYLVKKENCANFKYLTDNAWKVLEYYENNLDNVIWLT